MLFLHGIDYRTSHDPDLAFHTDNLLPDSHPRHRPAALAPGIPPSRRVERRRRSARTRRRGLGDAVCDVVSAECPVKVTKIGVNDRFGYSGPALELLDKFGLTQPHIAKVVRDVVKEDK